MNSLEKIIYIQDLPQFLQKEDANRIIYRLSEPNRIKAQLIYGSGLNASELLSLRIKDIDFRNKEIAVLDPNGKRPRKTLLPEKIFHILKDKIEAVRYLHKEDLKEGFGKNTPFFGAVKLSAKFEDQFLFPSKKRKYNSLFKTEIRDTDHVTVFQKALHNTGLELGFKRNINVNALRVSFGVQLILDNVPKGNIKEISGISEDTYFRYKKIARMYEDKGILKSPLD